MSFRPTLSIYLDGTLIHVSMLRNFREEDLFREAIAVAALCAVPDFREALLLSRDPEFDEEFLSCSEFPVAIDLDAGCIYISYEQLSAAKIAALDEVSSPVRDYGRMLETCRIPASFPDPYAILKMYRDTGLCDALSSATAGMLSFVLYKHEEELRFS